MISLEPWSTENVVKWTAEVREDGKVCFRLGRDGTRLVAEWPGICTLRADPDGGRSELLPAVDADHVLVDKLHRGLAKALLRHLEGKLTLHASSAAWDGVAVACVGESRAGKSTAAAELVRHKHAELVSDDTLAIDFRDDSSVFVHPTERVSWLDSDSRSALGYPEGDDDEWTKQPLEPRQAAAGESRLAALVLLGFKDDLAGPRLRRLRGFEAIERLVPSVVRFVVDEPERNRRELEQLFALTRAVPVYELTRPQNLEALAAVGDALRGLARNPDGGAS